MYGGAYFDVECIKINYSLTYLMYISSQLCFDIFFWCPLRIFCNANECANIG